MALPPESHRLRPDHLPTPFSAEQIRDGCPAGRTILVREESAGEEPSFRRIVFARVDAESSVQEFQAADAAGAPLGEASPRQATWLDLQRHASQPADATTVDEVRVSLPFGDFDCWLYTVHAPEAELRFWFAKELPGMPVQVEQWVDGAPIGRTVMIDNRPQPGDAGPR
ncbi:MAG: hypothetical protein ABI864_02125 [Chloroflexota bacterium]